MSFGYFYSELGLGGGMNWFMPSLVYDNFAPSFNPLTCNSLFSTPSFPDFNISSTTNVWNTNPFTINFNNTDNFCFNPFSQFFDTSASSTISFSASNSINNLSKSTVSESNPTSSPSKSTSLQKNDEREEDVTKEYNSQKGQKLASAVLAGIPSYRPKPLCARYVKIAIVNSGLGIYENGHANDMFEIMRHNSNFKEISPDDIDVSDLPAGCVIVYNKGEEGYSDEYGHTEITLGDGRAASDFIQDLYKKPSAIFMPV